MPSVSGVRGDALAYDVAFACRLLRRYCLDAHNIRLFGGVRQQAHGDIRFDVVVADIARIAAVGAQERQQRGGIAVEIEGNRDRIRGVHRRLGGCVVRGGVAVLDVLG